MRRCLYIQKLHLLHFYSKKHKINRISFHSTTSNPYPSFHFRSLKKSTSNNRGERGKKNFCPVSSSSRKTSQLRGVTRLPSPLPPSLSSWSFIVPSLFAWPLIRPLSVPLRHRYRSGGTSSGPESAFNNGSPFSWVQSQGTFPPPKLPPFEVDPATRVVPIARRRTGGGGALKEIAIADRCTINWLCTVISGKSPLPPGPGSRDTLFCCWHRKSFNGTTCNFDTS